MNDFGIKAVTFDLWNTLFVEVAPGISRDRAQIIASSFNDSGLSITADEAEIAINRAWREHRRRWVQGDRFSNVEAALSIAQILSLPNSAATLETIESALEYMYPVEKLNPCDNLEEMLHRLSIAGLRIGLISDTGFSPGKIMLQRIAQLGLCNYFNGTSFSDEVGVFKPHPAIFSHSLTYLDCAAQNTIHVGDLWKNDVLGARTAGFRTIRYRAWNDDQPDGVDADFVSDDHHQTVEWILAQL